MTEEQAKLVSKSLDETIGTLREVSVLIKQMVAEYEKGVDEL